MTMLKNICEINNYNYVCAHLLGCANILVYFLHSSHCHGIFFVFPKQVIYFLFNKLSHCRLVFPT